MKFLFFLISIFCLEDYIVLFKKRPSLDKFQAKADYENTMIKTLEHFSNQSFILDKLKNGFLAKLDNPTFQKIRNDENIAIIEKDQVIKTANYKVMDIFMTPPKPLHNHIIIQEGAPWGLSRILGKSYLKTRQYIYPENAGNEVEVFIIDTGINVLHPDFQGRARWGANFVPNTPNYDENGHGTHVAGVVGGFKYGICKNVSLVAVKVLDYRGIGMISSILKGVDYVIEEHEHKRDLLYDLASSKFLGKKRTKKLEETLENFLNESELQPKTVVNMSVGGGRSVALNFALDYAASLGIHFAVAAGNDQENACSYSPGSSKHALTVGASDINDNVADFSNYGQCVDIFAPGVDILSAWNNKKSNIASGTSMACPHVSGVMSLYLSLQSYTPENLKKKILEDSKNVITNKDLKQTFFNVLWPINWFSDQHELPLVSINKLMKNIIDGNNK